jgi:alginate O-acetyltransferase complex protein AlgI
LSFASLDFVLFFAAFFLVWSRLKGPGQKKALLLGASWIFYAWTYPPYLCLLLVSTLVSFALGLWMGRPGAKKKAVLALGLIFHLGLLAFFKYADFALGLWQSAFGRSPGGFLGIALPIGISFFTFHNISYLVDLCRGQLEPISSFTQYALYIAFFPQLVAGPLLRVREFVPQLSDEAMALQAPLWRRALAFLSLGFFKKVVLADSLAPLVDAAFSRPETLNWATALLALNAYAFQIYFDFSGYTDIAEGLANLLGFKLVENFKAPYLSAGLREFWQRWHISLSRWLRDYLYVSLGGSRRSLVRTFFALLMTMALGGLWHGAAMNFVLWGFFHGLLLVLEHAWGSFRGRRAKGDDKFRLPKQILTYHLVLLSWLLFRLPSMASFGQWLAAFGRPLQGLPSYAWTLCPLLVFCLGLHIWEDRKAEALRSDEGLSLGPLALAMLHTLILVLALAHSNQSNPFIYFRF